MPLYEYACEACGHRFEVLQSLSEAPLTTCEKCNGKVEKLLSSPAIQFKGSGWYVTDYAKKGADSPEPTGRGGGAPRQEPESKDAGKGPDKTAEKGSDASGGKTEPTGTTPGTTTSTKPSKASKASKESKE